VSIRLANMVVRCPYCDVVKRCIGIEDDGTKAQLIELMQAHVAEEHPDAAEVDASQEPDETGVGT
jgi:hypothetical protein